MENVEDIYPLTPVQEGMLFHLRRDPESAAYLTQITFEVGGQLDTERFRDAWRATVQAHPALRTCFLSEGLEEPLQVVREEVSLPFSTGPEAASSNSIPLDEAPLMRVYIRSLGEERHEVTWTLHHLISDGWSTPMILAEVFQRYDGLHNQTSPPPFRDFIAWFQEQPSERHEAFWRNELDGFSRPLRWKKRPSPETSQPVRLEQALSSKETASLEAFCRQQRLTPNTVILGAWNLVLSQWCEEEDVLLGVTVSGRPPGLPGVERMIGNFINTLPFRSHVDQDRPLHDWLQDLQTKLGSLREHEHTPLVDAQRWSSLPANQPLFQTIYVYEGHAELPKPHALSLSHFEHHEQSHYPLAALVLPGDTLTLLLIADPQHHNEAFLKPILACWKQLILSMIQADPGSKLNALRWLSEEEEAGLQSKGDTSDRDQRLVPDQIAAQDSSATAVVFSKTRLSYGDLNQRANQFAHRLRASGVKAGSRVGLLTERGPDMIMGILGILRAGGCYVPLDPSYPRQRLESMITDSGMHILCAQLQCLGTVNITDVNVNVIALDDDSISEELGTEPSIKIQGQDPAYVIYTSGSTGTPRGVEVTHANLHHSTMARSDYYQDRVESFLLLSSFAFDSSVAGIFWTLCQGGKLCILPESEQHHPGAMAEIIAEEDITHLLGVPSLYDALLSDRRASQLESLKAVIVAGETCPPALFSRHLRLLPQTSFFNEYGPSETTVWATVHRCLPQDAVDSLPIGRPITNTQVYVLDAWNRPLPPGFSGELCIGGDGVTSGYFNDPDRTADRFVSNPFNPTSKSKLYRSGDKAVWRLDGILEFLGRFDDQVQLHGLRIELGEIESALRKHPEIEDVVVAMQAANKLVESSPTALAALLERLPVAEAKALLAAHESSDTSSELKRTLRTPAYQLELSLSDPTFIHPPRDEQRQWLINQALEEWQDDLAHLAHVAKRFVPGTASVEAYDISQAALTADAIMEDWQTPIMKAMAEEVSRNHGDVLEIGFGRGISAEFIQSGGVRSHTVIESNNASVGSHFRPWRDRHAASDIRLVHARWQDALEQLGQYDGIFFHAFPLTEQEFIETVVESITFAEHFFPTAASLLRPGGVFTYLTTEIDSMSRRHQRALFHHFDSISMRVQPVSVPKDTRDTWWADSMIIVRAEKLP